MQNLDRTTALTAKRYPERIIQFGEGNFLRAFFDWMVYRMNTATGFASGVVVVQPIAQGSSLVLNAQGGLFHLVLSGVSNGKAVSEVTLIDSVQRALNPYEQFNDYLKLAENPDLRFMVSNTTEAGIAYADDDRLEMRSQ